MLSMGKILRSGVRCCGESASWADLKRGFQQQSKRGWFRPPWHETKPQGFFLPSQSFVVAAAQPAVSSLGLHYQPSGLNLSCFAVLILFLLPQWLDSDFECMIVTVLCVFLPCICCTTCSSVASGVGALPQHSCLRLKSNILLLYSALWGLNNLI
jgi:hypothetical protein